MTEEQEKSFEEKVLGALDGMNKRLDNMQLAVNGLVATNASIDFRLGELEKQTKENTKQIANLTEQTEKLTKQTEENTKQIAKLTEQTEENTRQIKSNREQLVYLTEQMTAIKMDQGTLQSPNKFEQNQEKVKNMQLCHQ